MWGYEIDLDGVGSSSRAIVEALQKHACLVVSGHGIEPEIFERIRAAAGEFFAQPAKEKLLVDIRDSRNHRGYVAVTEAGDYGDEGGIRRYEAFDIGLELGLDHPMVSSEVPLMGPNVWPDNSEFVAAASECYAALQAFTDGLLDQIADGLDLSRDDFRRNRRAPLSQMRLINYLDRPAGAAPHAAMGAHTDYEYLTAIWQQGPGLQVHLDDDWHELTPGSGRLVVLAGDLLEVASGGRIRSALHRVSDLPGTRFSIPFFAGADFFAEITPVEPTHPVLSARARVEPGSAILELRDEPVVDITHAGTGEATGLAPIVAGEHLLTQLQRDFPYLRTKYSTSHYADLAQSAANALTEPKTHPGEGMAVSSVSNDPLVNLSAFERRRVLGQ